MKEWFRDRWEITRKLYSSTDLDLYAAHDRDRTEVFLVVCHAPDTSDAACREILISYQEVLRECTGGLLLPMEEIGSEGGDTYALFRAVQGQSAASLIKRGIPLPEGQVLDWYRALLSALQEFTGLLPEGMPKPKMIPELMILTAQGKLCMLCLPDREGSTQTMMKGLGRILSNLTTLKPNVRTVAERAQGIRDPYRDLDEMACDLSTLKKRDPEYLAFHKKEVRYRLAFGLIFLAGLLLSLTGYFRIRMGKLYQSYAAEAKTLYEEGDVQGALKSVMRAYPRFAGPVRGKRVPEAQEVLTEILGVYDAASSYHLSGRVELSDVPENVALSMDGTCALVQCAQEVDFIDPEHSTLVSSMKVSKSEGPVFAFIGDHSALITAEDGLSCVDLSNGEIGWQADPVTMVCVSGDGSIAAAYDGSSILWYRCTDGKTMGSMALDGRVPDGGLFSLSRDGESLAVSLSDGGILLLNRNGSEDDLVPAGTYHSAEGGFSGDVLAFRGELESNDEVFVYDTAAEKQLYGAGVEGKIHLAVSGDDILLSQDGKLTRINPKTGENTGVLTDTGTITDLSLGDGTILYRTDTGLTVTDGEGVQLLSEDNTSAGTAGPLYAVMAETGESAVRILRKQEIGDPVLRYQEYDDVDWVRRTKDGSRWVLYGYTAMDLYDAEGRKIRYNSLGNYMSVVDLTWHEEENSIPYLQARFADGNIDQYSAEDGSLISETNDLNMEILPYDEYFANGLQIVTARVGVPIAYDAKSGNEVAALPDYGEVHDVFDVRPYFGMIYDTGENGRCGYLFDRHGGEVAEVPGLCYGSAKEQVIWIKCPGALIRECRLCSLRELIALGREAMQQ